MQNGSVATAGFKKREQGRCQVYPFGDLINLEAYHLLLYTLNLFFILTFISIFVIKICHSGDAKYLTLNSAFGIFVVTYSCVVLGISIPITVNYYFHCYTCAKTNCRSEDSIRRTIWVARSYFLLVPLSFNEVVMFYPKLTALQMTRIGFFLKGLQLSILLLLWSGFTFIRGIINRIGLWQNGKVILLTILIFAMLVVAFTETRDKDMVNADWRMNAAVMGLIGTITGLVFSLIFDWIVLHADAINRGDASTMQLLKYGNGNGTAASDTGSNASNATTAVNVV
jgi:hypothetical protein